MANIKLKYMLEIHWNNGEAKTPRLRESEMLEMIYHVQFIMCNSSVKFHWQFILQNFCGGYFSSLGVWGAFFSALLGL